MEHRLRNGRMNEISSLGFMDLYVRPRDPEYRRIVSILQDFNLLLMGAMHTAEPLSPRYAYGFDSITDRYIVYHTLED